LLVVWMVFFSAFDAIAGIAVGVLTRHANSLAGEGQDAVVSTIDFLFQESRFAGGDNYSVLGKLGQFSWVVSHNRRGRGPLARRCLPPYRRSDPSLCPLLSPRGLSGGSRAGRSLRR